MVDAGITRIQPRVCFCFQSTDKSEGKRLAARHEVVLSRVKLPRMSLPGRATHSIIVLNEC